MKKIAQLLAFILVLSGVVYGQRHQSFEQKWDSVLSQSVWQVGPFYLMPRIRLRNIGYDGNVYREREEDDPVQDYTATFSPEVTAYLLVGHSMILSFRENPEYVYYVNQERERRWNHIYSPEIKWKLFNRFVLGGKYNYANRRYRFSTEVDFRVNVQTKQYEGSLFYETARETSLGVRYLHQNFTYQDVDVPGTVFPWFSRLSRDEDTVTGELYYQLLSDSYFFLRGGYTQHRFLDVEASWRDSDSRQMFAGLQFPLLGRMRGTLSLGYKWFVPLDEEREDFSGLVGNADMEYRLRRIRLRAGYNRDNYFSYWGENLFYLGNQINGGVSFYISPSLRLDYDFRYGNNDYLEEALWGGPEGEPDLIRRKDIFTIHTVGVAVRILRDIGIGLNLNYWKRETNISYGDRYWWFVGGSLVYDF
ncbi:MAG: outer membrane beta-barrel protein [Candidatus Aminicenantes bacterium]|nr:outer membrane beta-barrel protein [Candidatus Aminicenantes bacterium]